MVSTTPVNVRIDTAALLALDAIGTEIEPKPLKRSEMINVAIKHYIACRDGGGKMKPKPNQPRK